MFVAVMLAYLEVFKVAAWMAAAHNRLDKSPIYDYNHYHYRYRYCYRYRHRYHYRYYIIITIVIIINFFFAPASTKPAG